MLHRHMRVAARSIEQSPPYKPGLQAQSRADIK